MRPLSERTGCLNFTDAKFPEPIHRMEIPYSDGKWNIMTTTRDEYTFTLVKLSGIAVTSADLRNTDLARLCPPPFPEYVLEHFGKTTAPDATVLVFDKFDYFLHEILDADYVAKQTGQTVLSDASRVLVAQQLVNGLQNLHNKEIYPDDIQLYNVVLTYSAALQNYEGRIFYFDADWFYQRYIPNHMLRKYSNEGGRWADERVRYYFSTPRPDRSVPSKMAHNVFQIALLIFYILSGQDYYQNVLQIQGRKGLKLGAALAGIPSTVTIPENWPGYLKEAFRVCLLDNSSKRGSLGVLIPALRDLAIQFNITGSITV